MSLVANGFDIGSQRLPWGTTLAEALTKLSGRVEADGRSAKFQSARAFGLTEILSVTLRAPALDRPVLQAWYELAQMSDRDLLENVTRIFGSPAQQTDYDLRAHRKPAFAVRRVLSWNFPGFDVGVSIYGAPRETAEGLSAAVFYVDWDDELAAAAPYLAVMTDFEDWLEKCALRAEIISREMLEVDQYPYQPGAFPKGSPPVDSALRRAARCLRKRLLYQTPASLAVSIEPNQVLVWKVVPDSIWCISTRYETVCFQVGQPVNATCLNLLPAKGGGATNFSISDMTLESTANSSALAHLSAFLRDEMGVQISLREDYDV